MGSMTIAESSTREPAASSTWISLRAGSMGSVNQMVTRLGAFRSTSLGAGLARPRLAWASAGCEKARKTAAPIIAAAAKARNARGGISLPLPLCAWDLPLQDMGPS